jgi:RIO kinase 1
MSSDDSSGEDYQDTAYEWELPYKPEKARALESRYSSAVNEAPYVPSTLSSQIVSSIRISQQEVDSNRIRIKDKGDRETHELVLDARTKTVLYKLISTERVKTIYGCVSTGKEANVYYAHNSAGDEFALKVFKTSILVFKDRDRYVVGEFRFRRGYSKGNPRKMVAKWAEKEVRNLKRIAQAGIPCPEPIYQKQNVIMMQFLGTDGVPAPRLKDVIFESSVIDFYRETVNLLRKMYQECKLVHADFSEYNLLYWNDQVYVIDVSQAVEHDHPHALDFLRRDCLNINDFFSRSGCQVASHKGLFDYITDLTPMDPEDRWERAMEAEQSEDNVFMEVNIPRTLQEVEILKDRSEQEPLFQRLTGLMPVEDTKQGKASEDSGESEESASEGEEEEGDQEKRQIGDAMYGGLTKQERKQRVKEEKRLQRSQKMPKHLKKQKIKKTTAQKQR